MSLSNVDARNEKQWRKPGELWRIRRFLSSARHAVSKACNNCHKLKVKCDGQKPCTRCKNKELNCDLCDEAAPTRDLVPTLSTNSEPSSLEKQFLVLRNSVLAARLDRPLPYSPNGIIFNDNCQEREQRSRLLPHRMLRMAWDSGFAEKDFIECFKYMTPALSSAIDTALSAVEKLAFSGESPPVSTESSSPRVDDFTLQIQDSDRVGILQQCWDPQTRRRIAANFNNYMAHLTGAPREVGLTALGRSECRCALTDLRFICHVLQSLLSFTKDEDVNYLRWSPLCMRGEWDKAILVRMTRRLSRDAQNRPNAVKMYYTVVTETEYDAARRLDPEICEPLVASLPGSAQTGAELLSEVNIDRKESFRGMIASAEGRAKMDALAQGVLTRFAGVIAAASAVPAPHPQGPSSSAARTAPPPALSISTAASSSNPRTPSVGEASPAGQSCGFSSDGGEGAQKAWGGFEGFDSHETSPVPAARTTMMLGAAGEEEEVPFGVLGGGFMQEGMGVSGA